MLPSHRRYGIARFILTELERHAVAVGYRLLRLETGFRQQPALRLYDVCGFKRIDASLPTPTILRESASRSRSRSELLLRVRGFSALQLVKERECGAIRTRRAGGSA